MKLASTLLICIQVFLSIIAECLMVENISWTQARMRALRQQMENANNIIRKIFKHPSNRKKVVLMCFNKNYLVMIKDKLQGSKDPKIVKKYGKLVFSILLRYRLYGSSL